MPNLRRPFALLGLAVLLVVATACPPKKPTYPSCDGDKDCKPGETCVNRKCELTAPKPECTADGDCEHGQVCRENKCVACQADNECGDGGKCIEGGCLRKGQCHKDEDCPEDQDCVNNVCTSAGAAAGEKEPACKLEALFFGYDQYTLDDAAKALLQRDAECLSSTPRKVAVAGLTDPRGTDEYNIGLSDHRAQTVIMYLMRLGVAQERLRKVPKGESEATGTDDAGWTKDRRVEFTWD